MSEIIHLRDGEVVLYKRPHSSKWQARFKLADGKWHSISTKTRDVDKAGKAACKEYDNARFRAESNFLNVRYRSWRCDIGWLIRLDKHYQIIAYKL